MLPIVEEEAIVVVKVGPLEYSFASTAIDLGAVQFTIETAFKEVLASLFGSFGSFRGFPFIVGANIVAEGAELDCK